MFAWEGLSKDNPALSKRLCRPLKSLAAEEAGLLLLLPTGNFPGQAQVTRSVFNQPSSSPPATEGVATKPGGCSWRQEEQGMQAERPAQRELEGAWIAARG